jgi:hypothetical protein
VWQETLQGAADQQAAPRQGHRGSMKPQARGVWSIKRFSVAPARQDPAYNIMSEGVDADGLLVPRNLSLDRNG